MIENPSSQSYRLIANLLVDQSGDQGLEGLTGLGKDEVVLFRGPVQLEAGGEGGDPDLVDGGIGRNDELGGRIVKGDVDSAAGVLDFKIGILLSLDQRLLEGIQRAFGLLTRSEVGHGGIVKHGART